MSIGEPINHPENLEPAPGTADYLDAANTVEGSVFRRLKDAGGKVAKIVKTWAAGPALSVVTLAVFASSACGNIEKPLPVSPNVEASVQQLEQKTEETYSELMKKIEEDAKTSGPYFAFVEDPEGTIQALLFPISTTTVPH